MEQKLGQETTYGKTLLIGALCYVMWGLLPLYWHLLSGFDPLFILANRILWSAVFMLGLTACTGRLKLLVSTFRDWKTMRFLIPAALVITVNWGTYIWAVNSGRGLDASLGYYMNPLVVFAIGLALFHEHCGAAEWIALGLAAAGVLYAALAYGEFPYAAIVLAVSFAAYGTLKKFAHVDGLISTTVETLVIAPLALLYLILTPASRAAVSALTLPDGLLLLCSGAVTALPLVLYARGVNTLPFTTMGFLQFISPTLMLLVSLFVYHEPFSKQNAVAFALIWAGLAVYMFAALRRERRAARSRAE